MHDVVQDKNVSIIKFSKILFRKQTLCTKRLGISPKVSNSNVKKNAKENDYDFNAKVM